MKATSVASAVSTRVENVVEEFEPTASSTLVENGSKAMRKLLEFIDSVCCIYDVDSRNVARQYKLSGSEDNSGKESFVVVHPH